MDLSIGFKKAVADIMPTTQITDKPIYKKRYDKVHKKQPNSCVRTCLAECRGEAPARKNVVILRRRPQTAMPPKNLVPRPFTSAARCLYGVV